MSDVVMSDNDPSPLTELSLHLQKVDEDPATILDVQLLEQCELYTSTPSYRNDTWQTSQTLFFQIAQLLPNLQQDPSSLIHFILKLAEPYSFDYVKDLDFCMGLDLAAKPFHLLILSLLEKASASSNGAEKLANRPDVVCAVVRLWLCTDDPGVATKSANLLTSLLTVSKNLPNELSPAGVSLYGRGPMWKRLFEDRDIYTLFYFFCSHKPLSAGEEKPLNKRDKTISQARLMEWLPRVGTLDWGTITASHYPEIEKQVGLEKGEGLLHFAALKMVDTDDDILMHIALMNSFSDLLSTVKMASPNSPESSVSLEWLKTYAIHKTTLDVYFDDTPSIEKNFLNSPSANYISVYASTYPDAFDRSAEMSVIRQQLNRVVSRCAPEDLHVLSSLPRTCMVPQTPNGGFAWNDSPLLSIPITRTNADALKTLATIFLGPLEPELSYPPPSPAQIHVTPARHESEKFHARLLFSLFLSKNPNFFNEIIRHADMIAMKENALAAILLLRALLTANWSSKSPFPDSSDPMILRLASFPATGVEVILDPTISGGVLSYLMKPATTFSGLVGGRGDAESAAYQVAMAKFDLLRVMEGRLKRLETRRGDVEGMVARRIADGPWGSGGNVGSRIGTLEL